MVVQHSIHANAAEACLLGLHPSVTEIIGDLSIADIERIVERRFRYIQPRLSAPTLRQGAEKRTLQKVRKLQV